MTADLGRRARVREAVGSAVQYGLLFGFAAVAAAISAHGLVGFARANMGLAGPWPYLLWGALDGAAGLCAVLLMRRAARGESALAPWLAVWGLVAASSLFNWTHAPDHAGAREAFALMPVIAATLFEFSLRETRHTARRTERRLAGLGWLRPAERIRVQMQLSADPGVSAEEATRRVRVEFAARRLHTLRLALAAQDRAGKPRAGTSRRVRRAERRAQAALTRARFADPALAAGVLRQVQVLTLTGALARLDYTTAGDSRALLASLITARDSTHPLPGQAADHHALTGRASPNGHSLPQVNGTVGHLLSAGVDGSGGGISPPFPVGFPPPSRNGHGDRALIDAAARLVAQAREDGDRLSQAALARRLRAEGFHIANERLRWLAAVSGLEPDSGQM